MSAIPSKAKRKITKLIGEIVDRYLIKAQNNPKSNSGNPFVMAMLEDFEPLLHRIHGFRTSLGGEMEKIAEIIAVEAWGKENVLRKQKITVKLPPRTFHIIDSILSNLTDVKVHPNYQKERKEILRTLGKSTNRFQEHRYEFDLELFDTKKQRYYFLEMKGPDPNTTEVPGAKRRLLTALAYGVVAHKTKKVDSSIGIYYNNKYPSAYKNPKVHNYFDPSADIKVHENFWNFIGRNPKTFSELLQLFKQYGKNNKKKIWNGFSKLIKLE